MRIVRIVIAVVAALAAAQAPVLAEEQVPFAMNLHGTFVITFGLNGTAENHFTGTGHARHLGRSSIDGVTDLAPASTPGCFDIVKDHVVVTGANGDTVDFINSGRDCLQTVGGQTLIHGTGSYTIVGGTGRFTGATGQGTFDVSARVLAFGPGNASGIFDRLHFAGTISSPGSLAGND